MNISSFRRRAFAAAIAGTFLLAACGGDDDDDAAATTAAPATTAAATATTAGRHRDHRRVGHHLSRQHRDHRGRCGDDEWGGSETTTGKPLSGTLVGSGATSQAAAMQAWTVGFQVKNPDATINYDPVGSGGGRTAFLAGGADFAGSDAALSDDDFTKSKDRCGADGAIDLPALHLADRRSPTTSPT